MNYRLPRRTVLFVLVFAVACPYAARAESLRTVAIVKSRDLAPYNAALRGLRRSLAASDPDVQLRELVLPSGEARVRSFLDSLTKSRPDIIVTIGTQATRAVTRRVQDIPIVFSLVLTKGSLEAWTQRRPSNVTGAAMDVPMPVQFRRLKEVIPDMQRVGVIYNPRETGALVGSARDAAAGAGLTLVEIPVSSEAQVIEEVSRLKGRIDALWSVADSTVFTPRSVDQILLLTLRDGIPFVGLSPSFVKAGALLSFSCDYEDVGSQSGELVSEVLNGKSPTQIAIAYPRHVSLFLNLNTARAIHLEISAEVQAGSQVQFKE